MAQNESANITKEDYIQVIESPADLIAKKDDKAINEQGKVIKTFQAGKEIEVNL